jgi:hypothetical protein
VSKKHQPPPPLPPSPIPGQETRPAFYRAVVLPAGVTVDMATLIQKDPVKYQAVAIERIPTRPNPVGPLVWLWRCGILAVHDEQIEDPVFGLTPVLAFHKFMQRETVVPGAPTGVTAVAGTGQATVSWTAPASSGGSDITGYTATSTPGGLTANVDGSTLTAIVTGLTNGTAYTFKVTATNTAGVGPASAASNSVTPS